MKVTRWPIGDFWYGMDNMVVSLFFWNGLLLGGFCLFLMLAALRYAAKGIALQSTDPNDHIGYWAAVPFVAILGYFGTFFTGLPYSERYTGVIFGVLFALSIFLGHEANRRQRSQFVALDEGSGNGNGNGGSNGKVTHEHQRPQSTLKA
jgi:hypothetical protein